MDFSFCAARQLLLRQNQFAFGGISLLLQFCNLFLPLHLWATVKGSICV